MSTVREQLQAVVDKYAGVRGGESEVDGGPGAELGGEGAGVEVVNDERLPMYARLRGKFPVRKRAAVLVLFGALDSIPAVHPSEVVPSDLDVLLLRRSDGLRSHAGQIAFPGGGWEEGDETLVDTALREAVEETGLDPDGVKVLGTLPVTPTVSGYEVTPVLAVWEKPSKVAPVDVNESVDVFRTPVADLLSDDVRCITEFERDGKPFRMPAYRLQQGVLWGFTATVLTSILTDAGWLETGWMRPSANPVKVEPKV